LNALDRRILLLTLIEGMNPRDIAPIVGLKADVVRTRKARAREGGPPGETRKSDTNPTAGPYRYERPETGGRQVKRRPPDQARQEPIVCSAGRQCHEMAFRGARWSGSGGLALIPRCCGPIAGQGGGSKSGLTAEVTFRNDDSDMIQGDNLVGGVPILGMINASWRILAHPTTRRPAIACTSTSWIRVWRLPDYPNCWPWRLPKTWTLLLPPDISNPTSVRISTYVQFTYETKDATWGARPRTGPGGKVNEHAFSLFELRPRTDGLRAVRDRAEGRVHQRHLHARIWNRDWDGDRGKSGGHRRGARRRKQFVGSSGRPNDRFHLPGRSPAPTWRRATWG